MQLHNSCLEFSGALHGHIKDNAEVFHPNKKVSRIYFYIYDVRQEAQKTTVENEEFRIKWMCFDPIQRDLLLEMPKGLHCIKASFIIESHGMNPVDNITV